MSSFPKKALFAYFEKILSDFGLLFNYNVEITPIIHGEDFHNTQENILNSFSQHFFNILALWRHLDPPKQHFLSILDNFCTFSLLLNYNMEITPHQTIVEIVHNTEPIFKQNFSPFWPYDVILTPKQHFLSILCIFFHIPAFYSTMTWKLPNKPWFRLLMILKKIFETNFLQKFSPF